MRIFLAAQSVVWVGYGLLCWFAPHVLYTLIGFQPTHWSVEVEIRSMYGAAQVGIGLFAVLGAWRPERHGPSAVAFFAILLGALSVGRTIALLAAGQTLGIAWGEFPASYNAGVLLCFEVPMWITAMWLLRSSPQQPEIDTADHAVE